ncbi:MAG: 16S rRNA (cytosine(967)-C(5))-methyltransferase RsmB [Clostridia bacterium]
MNSREFVYNVLLLVEQQHIFVNDYLKDNHSFESFDIRDKSLAYKVIYGVIQNKLLLDYQIDQFLKNPTKLSIKARIILRIVAYQSIFLDTIPAHANCSTAVNSAKKLKLGKLAGLINAISRKLVKVNYNNIILPNKSNLVYYLSIKYSHPKWLINRWLKHRGKQDTIATLEKNNETLPTTIRINPKKISLELIRELLEEKGYEVSTVELTPQLALNVDKGSVFKTDLFENGLITIQDQGAIKACLLLDLDKGQRILDMCSAPGGKTALIGNLLDNQGEIIAIDINKNKLKLVDEICKRMGVIAKTIQADATSINENEFGLFDRIILDAPCSGLGTLRTKPEVRWYRNMKDIIESVPLQIKLLANGLKLLKENGILVYVTCSNEIEETDEVIRARQDIEILKSLQLYPFKFNTEGFYIAVIKKKGIN